MLERHDGDIAEHREAAGAQGFVTNIGGLVTMALTIPANICGNPAISISRNSR